MKISVISLVLPYEKMGWVIEFLTDLSSVNNEVTLIRGVKRCYGVDCIKPKGITCIDIPLVDRKLHSLPWRMLEEVYFSAVAALKLALLPGQDVILCLTPPIFSHFIPIPHLYLRNKNVRIFLWNMDCHPEIEEKLGLVRKEGLLCRLMNGLHRLCSKKITAVISLDEAMAYELRTRRYKQTPIQDRIHIIPNWSTPYYNNAKVHGSQGSLWSFPEHDGAFRILYAGNAGRVHEFDTILAAAHIIQEKWGRNSISLVFLGSGYARDHIQRRIKEMALLNTFLCDEVPRESLESVVIEADVSLITLNSNMGGLSSPSKLYTSLMVGKPILYVGPPKGNVEEVIQKFACGISVRNDDIDGCVHAIINLQKDIALRKKMGENALTAYNCQFNPSQSYLLFKRLFAAESMNDNQPDIPYLYQRIY